MKAHNLFYHASIILESEDDLFPGIDSSAFDEHDKQKKREHFKPTANAELDWIDKQVEKYTDINWRSFREAERIELFLENNQALEERMTSSRDIEYKTLEWLRTKYPEAYERLDEYFAMASSPILDDLPKYMARLNWALERTYETGEILEKLNTQMDEVNG